MNQEYLIFVLARVIALISRPIYLIILISLGFREFSVDYALAITLFQGALVFLNSEAHKKYYQIAFNEVSSELAKFRALKRYLLYFKNHCLLAAGGVFLFCFYMTDDPLLAVFMSFGCIFEKVYDEIQRYYIYSRKYIAWARVCLLKFFVPIIFSFFTLFGNEGWAIYSFVLSHIFIVAIHAYLSVLKKLPRTEYSYSIKFYLKNHLVKNRLLLAYSLLVSNAVFLDRLIVGSYFQGDLDRYLLMCNIGVAMVVFFDYLYLSKIKPDLMSYSPKPLKYIANLKNISFSLFPVFIAISILLLKIPFFQAYIFDTKSAIALVVAYGLYNLVSPLVIYAYWNVVVNQILYAEFFAAACYFSFLFYSINFGLLGITLSVALYMLIRLALYLWVVSPEKNAGRIV